MAEPHSKPHQIFVDRRPLWIVLFDRLRRYLFLGLFFGVFFVLLMTVEGPSDLSVEGYKVLCLFLLCVLLWSTNLIPLSITSLLAIAAVPLLGVMEASQAYSYFGNKAVFFILGVFILSASMNFYLCDEILESFAITINYFDILFCGNKLLLYV